MSVDPRGICLWLRPSFSINSECTPYPPLPPGFHLFSFHPTKQKISSSPPPTPGFTEQEYQESKRGSPGPRSHSHSRAESRCKPGLLQVLDLFLGVVVCFNTPTELSSPLLSPEWGQQRIGPCQRLHHQLEGKDHQGQPACADAAGEGTPPNTSSSSTATFPSYSSPPTQCTHCPGWDV